MDNFDYKKYLYERRLHKEVAYNEGEGFTIVLYPNNIYTLNKIVSDSDNVFPDFEDIESEINIALKNRFKRELNKINPTSDTYDLEVVINDYFSDKDSDKYYLTDIVNKIKKDKVVIDLGSSQDFTNEELIEYTNSLVDFFRDNTDIPEGKSILNIDQKNDIDGGGEINITSKKDSRHPLPELDIAKIIFPESTKGDGSGGQLVDI